MQLKKWKRWNRTRKNMPKRNRKRQKLLTIEDDLHGAQKPPEWMRELLFSDEDIGIEKGA